MFANIIRRFRRAPLPSLAVVALAVVLSAALCGLQAVSIAQQKSYEETRRTIPVTLRVTNLSATRWDGLDLPRWALNAFTGFGLREERSLKEFVKDIQCKMSYDISTMDLNGTTIDTTALVGISTPDSAPDLGQRKSGIKWFDGYDESVLAGEEPVCLLPRSLLPEDYDGSTLLTVTFQVHYSDGFSVSGNAEHTLTVVGTHGAGSTVLYCPYETMRDIYGSISRPYTLDAISATLVDNDRMDEARERASLWFAEPNPTGEKTKWDYSYYFYYPYALDIDTSLLDSAEMTLKTSLLMGQLCAYLIFILSAGSGFLIGFLMIRQRKREIALLRTMGTPNTSIYASFALEQMVCILAGTLLGGAFFLWQPIERLGLFLGIYFVGLTVALLVFLNKNLLTAIKEDE